MMHDANSGQGSRPWDFALKAGLKHGRVEKETYAMNLSEEQIRALLQAVSLTRDQELTCDECLGQLGSFAELTLEERPVEEAHDLVQQHLQICDECREEFALLLKALQTLVEPQS
jgi:hypothetical protein